MKKSKAIIILLVFVLLLGGFGYTAVVGLGADASGSAASINLGLDLEGGVSITYQAVGEEDPSAEDMADTIYKLQKRVEGYSTEAVVYQEGTDRINIEIPGVSDANVILEDLGKPGSLYFVGGAVLCSGKCVKNDFQIFRRHTISVVLHLDPHTLVGLPELPGAGDAKPDISALLCIFNRIGQQIDENLIDPGLIPHQMFIPYPCYFQMEFLAFGPGHGPDNGIHGRYQII